MDSFKVICRHRNELHIVRLDNPNNEPSSCWYWQIISIESFISRLLNFSVKQHPLVPNAYCARYLPLYSRYDEIEIEVMKSMASRMEKKFIPPTEIVHDTVWEFYDYIGHEKGSRSCKPFMVSIAERGEFPVMV